MGEIVVFLRGVLTWSSRSVSTAILHNLYTYPRYLLDAVIVSSSNDDLARLNPCCIRISIRRHRPDLQFASQYCHTQEPPTYKALSGISCARDGPIRDLIGLLHPMSTY